MDLEYRNSFHLLTSEHLLQMTIFEKMVEFDIFYRDPKKCLSPLSRFFAILGIFSAPFHRKLC